MKSPDTQLRDRIVRPLSVILLSLVATEVLAFSLSRVLLATKGLRAVAVATLVAGAILLGSAVAAARPRIKSSSLRGVLILAVLATIGAGIVFSGAAAVVEERHAGAVVSLELTATNVDFDKDLLEAEAGSKVEIDFINQDPAAIQHNFGLYADDSASDEIFRGRLIAGGSDGTYDFEAPEPGEYYFQCDVHPAMSGAFIVK